MLSLLSALALAAAQAGSPPTAPLPPTTIDETLEIEGDALGAQQSKTRMFVPVLVNGKGPYRFLVDSGADRSVIGQALAKTLALPEGDTVLIQNVAGSTRASTVEIENLTIGTSRIPYINAPALPEKFIGAEGLLGIDALAEQRLMMDFEKKAITVQDSRRPETAEPGDIIVTARLRHGQLILTQASAGRVPIRAVIDSGAQLTVGNSALRAAVFRARTPPDLQTITLVSVTGQTILAELTVLPQLRIGKLTLSNVPVAFVDAPPFRLFGLADQPALMVGTDVLEIFRRVSLDFRNRKVRFVPR